MIYLVSPEYNLDKFCKHMYDKDPVEIIETASSEISRARRLHRDTTKESDFHKGSKGREYCDHLQKLISLLMNGRVPTGATPDFLFVVKPLVLHLLKKWEIGNLRQFFTQLQQSERFTLPEMIDPLVVGVSRAEVNAMDTSSTITVLERLIESPITARKFVERVDIAFDGYNHTSQELFEITEVRNFVYQLDEQFPFWLFFLSKRHLGLQCILLCFLPPFLTDDARARIYPERLNKLLTSRWFPAMNHICEYVGFSEKQIEQLTDRAFAYITTGRFPPDSERFA